MKIPKIVKILQSNNNKEMLINFHTRHSEYGDVDDKDVSFDNDDDGDDDDDDNEDDDDSDDDGQC